MSILMLFESARKKWILGSWLLLVTLIPLVSVFGRALQRAAKSMVPSTGLALFFGTLSLLLVVALAIWLKRHVKPDRVWHLVWLVPLFLFLPLSLPLVEERLHFLLFGGFGFFSMLLFPPPVALAVSLLGSGLDELLQWALPDRVGDWQDVRINVLASLGGAAAAFFGRER